MIDCHIHIEKGPYTVEWINEFIKVAVNQGIDEIWLLEHCYRFREFIPMYESVCKNNEYINTWFYRKAGVFNLDDFWVLINKIRSNSNPIKIKVGLEVCYFKQFEDLVYTLTKDKDLDFIVGSVHFIDDFAFDHKSEFWSGVEVNKEYHRYFETSIELAKSGIYDGIAHPDSIKVFGHKPSFSLSDYYSKLAIELKKNNMYAEQNSGIYRRGVHGTELGMSPDMLKIFKEIGVKIITASDAHRPIDVGANIADMEKQIAFL